MDAPFRSPHEYISLTLAAALDLYPTAPFNFDATLHKPDHFPSADHAWEPGTRWQTMTWQGKVLGLKLHDQGTPEAPHLTASIYTETEEHSPGFRAAHSDSLDSSEAWRSGNSPIYTYGFDKLLLANCLADEITYRFNLQLDLNPFYERFTRTKAPGDDTASKSSIVAVIQRWYGMRPANFASLYEYLIIAILLQNATVRRSVNMLQRLFEQYGRWVMFDGREFFAFWQPETIAQASEAELRALKVGYRAKSILRVTQAFVEKQVDEMTLRQQPVDIQRQALLKLYGIGPASVGYILFDVFHQLDELNYISPWEQKIYSKLFFDRDVDNPMPVPDLLSYFQEQFGGYRMLAVHYFWEDLFWRRKNAPVDWLEKLIRL